MRRAPLLAIAVFLCTQPVVGQQPLIDWICGTGLPGVLDAPRAVTARQALWVQQSPPVLTADYAGTVEFTIAYAADVPVLRVFHHNGRSAYVFDEFPRTQIVSLDGTEAHLFKASWPMGEFLRRFGMGIDWDSGLPGIVLTAPATTPLIAGGFPAEYFAFSIRSMSRSVGQVPVVQIDETAQYSSHVINLVLPGFSATTGPAGGFIASTATRRMYEYLGDDYDQIGIVFGEKPATGNAAAYHSSIKSEIAGIGLELYDSSAVYGSAGRLQGVDVYYHGLGNIISNHELSHQWGHYVDWQSIAGVTSPTGRTPLWGHYESPIPQRISPWLRLVAGAAADVWAVQPPPEPTQIPPLQAYAMGRLPAASVPVTRIFDDQSQVSAGATIARTSRQVTIDQIVARHGVRQGPVIESVRRATVLISRDRLATRREMDYWTFYTQRLEDPNRTGMINFLGVGSFEAISGVPLRTSLVLPPGVSLTGHAQLEPTAIDPRDFAGLTLDVTPRLVLPTSGVFRFSGRIDDPALRPARWVSVSYGDGIGVLVADVAADGSFAINAPLNWTAGRANMSVTLDFGSTSTSLMLYRNVRFVTTPMAPSAPVALAAAVSGRSVSLQWSPDTGTTPSMYWVDVGSSAGASNLGSFPTTSAALAASNVADGTYFVRVRAQNAAGFSAPSVERSIVVGCPPPLPPGTLTGSAAGTTVTLTWLPSATAGVTYTVLAGSSSGTSNIAQVGAGTGTSLTAVAPVGLYFIRIRAVAPCGAAADSNEITLPVGLPPLPGAPVALAQTVAGHTVSLTWQAAAGTVTGYAIEAGSGPGLSNLAMLPLGPLTTFSVAGVPGGTYYVRVRATNATGQGPPSNEVIVVVP